MIDKNTYTEAKKTVDTYEQQLKQSAVNCWAFNVNDHILVKLKDSGFKYWLKKYNEWLPAELKVTIETLKEKSDKDGYVEFQAWEFLKLFGETISQGTSPIFETTVRLYRNEMKPCS